jgi:hypothetical protein
MHIGHSASKEKELCIASNINPSFVWKQNHVDVIINLESPLPLVRQ